MLQSTLCEHSRRSDSGTEDTAAYDHRPTATAIKVCHSPSHMSHIVNSCPLTKFDGGLLRLHEADEAAVDWLTTYGS